MFKPGHRRRIGLEVNLPAGHQGVRRIDLPHRTCDAASAPDIAARQPSEPKADIDLDASNGFTVTSIIWRGSSPLLRPFGHPTTRQWEKLTSRILASDRDGRSDPIVRCALCYSTIAERRSGSTTECDRALS